MVILPVRNEADLEDLPDEVRQQMKFAFTKTIHDVLDAALEGLAISNELQTDK